MGFVKSGRGDRPDRGGAGRTALRRRADALGRVPHRPGASSPRCCRRRSNRSTSRGCGRWSAAGSRTASAISPAASIYVCVRHEGVEGDYNLAQYMDNDVPTIYGRDLFGEPKKIGRRRADAARRPRPRLDRARRRPPGRAGGGDEDRPRPLRGRGLQLQLQGAAGGHRRRAAKRTRSSPAPTSRSAPATSLEGDGQHDPARHASTTRSTRSRSAEVIRATYLECDLVASCEPVGHLPAAVHAPYHHGHHDDWSQTRHRSGEGRRVEVARSPYAISARAGRPPAPRPSSS